MVQRSMGPCRFCWNSDCNRLVSIHQAVSASLAKSTPHDRLYLCCNGWNWRHHWPLSRFLRERRADCKSWLRHFIYFMAVFPLSRVKSIIVHRNKAEHGRWMARNYALTCAAITLRLYTTLAAGIWKITDTNESFFVIAWICWVPNLLFIEMLMSRKSVLARRMRTVYIQRYKQKMSKDG